MDTKTAELVTSLLYTIGSLTLAFALVRITARYARSTARMVEVIQRQTDASVYLAIAERMDKLRPERRAIFEFLEFSTWDDRQKDRADALSIEFETVSHLASRLIDSELVMEQYAAVFNDCWNRLTPFIEDLRLRSGYPHQRIHFENFASRCRLWLEARHLRTGPLKKGDI